MITRLSGRVSERARAGLLIAAALWLVSPLVPWQGRASTSGSITGQVRLSARVPRRTLASPAYISRAVHRANEEESSELPNVVIYLKNAPGEDDLPAMRAEIRQQDEEFIPHVVAITRGSSIEFPNSDPFFHNVFSLSQTAEFDLGRFPKGQKRVRRFTKSGVVKVFCHLHSHMSGVILIFDHPYFTTADTAGSFSLAAVPAGRYTLTAWHERIGESDISLTVEAGRLATASFTLPVLDR